MSLKPKSKRTIFSDSDCHTLVDIVLNYKDIVECKQTDSVTWKQKVATWEKIAGIFNSATTEPRTSEQLRCKFDNLKKDVRKYEARKRQNMYRTGGGIDEIDIKEALKLLYAKIKSIISFSVKGLEPSQGDSDVFKDSSTGKGETSVNYDSIEIIYDDDILPSTSQAVEVEKDVLKQFEHSLGERLEKFENISDTPQSCQVMEIKNDWSDYTPKKLQSKKHKVLQTKRKRKECETSSYNLKEEHILLKNKLLEEEAVRNQEFQEKKNKREEELHLLKVQNLALQNKKMELEIKLLEKQLFITHICK